MDVTVIKKILLKGKHLHTLLMHIVQYVVKLKLDIGRDVQICVAADVVVY